jgi:hypothetical protein
MGIGGPCSYGQGGGWPLPPDLALRPPEEDPVDLKLWVFAFFGVNVGASERYVIHLVDRVGRG